MINSTNVRISAFWLSVRHFIIHTSGRKGANVSLGSSINMKSVISVCVAHANNFCRTVRTGTSSCIVLWSPPLFLGRDSASVPLCFIPARWLISNSNTDNLKRHRDSFPVVSSTIKIHRSASWTVRLVKLASSK